MSLSRLYNVLEFGRVLDDLARRSHCSYTAKKIRRIKPFSHREEAQDSLDRISEIRGLMDRGGSFPMGPFDDIRPHFETASVEGSLLDPQAFQRIHKVLAVVQTLYPFMEQNRDTLPHVAAVSRALTPDKSLSDEIGRVIDLQSLEVRDHASPALGSIRRELGKARERVRRELERLLGKLAEKGVLQDRLITMRSGRWVLPVKETHRHLVKGVLHDKSASGATAFMEPLETLEWNNRIRRLEAEERHEVEKVLRLLTERVRAALPVLEENFYCLVTLDAYYAMALTSRAHKQYAPALSVNGVLHVRNGRHPLLLLKKNASTIVPLNLSVGDGFNTLVITGPNAGGKTVALKTVGLLALMTACGLHIPADADSEIPVFKRLFVLVGDAQSIEMDLSTFSARLGELQEIVQEGTRGDLVLIDEIGSGTDPQEGSALAMAILEVLTARGIVTVVTTHHGSLKAFAHRSEGVANGSMAFDRETLTPTYAFRAHLPGSSYALEIARRLGIPEAIVARSKDLMGKEANRLEELILELEKQIVHNKALKASLDEEKVMAGKLRKEWETRRRRLQEEMDGLRQKAVREARTIVKEAKATVENAVRTIREQAASKKAIQEAKALIHEEQKGLEKHPSNTTNRPLVQRETGPKGAFRRGTQVHWKDGHKRGTVLEEKDHGGKVCVAFGDLKIHVPEEELRLVPGQPSTGSTGRLQVHVAVPSGIRSEIDLRGMRVEEALSVADKFLSDAILAGLQEVTIIHGIGTGVLRKNISSFLQDHPLVLDTAPEQSRPSNPGATVVALVSK